MDNEMDYDAWANDGSVEIQLVRGDEVGVVVSMSPAEAMKFVSKLTLAITEAVSG